MTRPDPALLADLDAGLLDPAHAQEVRAAALADPRSAAVLEALRSTRADLAALPAPALPPALTQRWLAALAADTSSIDAGMPDAGMPYPPSGASGSGSVGSAAPPAPDSAARGSAAPGSAAPGSAAPGSPAPGSPAPGSVAPRSARPDPAAQGPGILSPWPPGRPTPGSAAPAADSATPDPAVNARGRPEAGGGDRPAPRAVHRGPWLARPAPGRLSRGTADPRRANGLPSRRSDRPSRLTRRQIGVSALLAAALFVGVVVAVIGGGRGAVVDVTRVELAAVARSTIGVDDLGVYTDGARRTACLGSAGHPGATVVGGRAVRLDGSPGVLLVLTTGVLGRFRVLLVDDACRVLADEALGG